MYQYPKDCIKGEWNLSQYHSQLLLPLNSREDKLSMLNPHVVYILIYLLFLDSQQALCILFLLLPTLSLNKIIAWGSWSDLCRLVLQNKSVLLQKNQHILSLNSCLSRDSNNLLLLPLLSLGQHGRKSMFTKKMLKYTNRKMSDWRKKETCDFKATLNVFKQNTQNWRLAVHVSSSATTTAKEWSAVVWMHDRLDN